MSDRETPNLPSMQEPTPKSEDFEWEESDPDVDPETERDEQDALMEAYLSNLQAAQVGDVRAASVVAIGDDVVLVNLDDKSEGMASPSEFCDAKGNLTVKVGDRVDVLIESRDAESGQIIVSHRGARRLIALELLEKTLTEGTTMTGEVTKAVKSGLLVDCGIECFMPASQIDLRRVENLDSWVGQTVEFAVLELNRRRGRAVISRRKAMEIARDRSRERLMSRLTVADVVQGTVQRVLGFGAFVDVEGVEAFIPREEVSWEKTAAPIDHLRPGNAVAAKVLKLSPETGKITLSRRQMTPDPWTRVEQKYPKGSIVSGEVTGLTKFGAFVRLEEGLTGLVHVSDLSWSSAPTRPEDVLKEGDSIQAAVLDIDTQRQRLSLGLKQISEDPWVEAETKFPPKSRVKGVVAGIAKFGVFVRLAENIEGLIHQSDLSWAKTPPTPAETFKVGDEVEAIVLKTDKKTRRISLGLKQMTPSPLQAFASRHPNGSAIDGTVVSVIDSGAFLELAPEIEGFLPVSYLAEEKVKKVGDVLKVGDKLTVKIVRLDVQGNRITLNRKAYLQEEERARVKAYLKDDDAKGGLNLGELLQDISLPRPE
ncbi:MAG: 30S ribosomal protein S1 [Candidatus Sumerlaeota bacterium]|nr:30S ribosomal protein S1 [Candidatus Sumerlaeota bacterium]